MGGLQLHFVTHFWGAVQLRMPCMFIDWGVEEKEHNCHCATVGITYSPSNWGHQAWQVYSNNRYVVYLPKSGSETEAAVMEGQLEGWMAVRSGEQWHTVSTWEHISTVGKGVRYYQRLYLDYTYNCIISYVIIIIVISDYSAPHCFTFLAKTVRFIFCYSVYDNFVEEEIVTIFLWQKKMLF